MNIYIYVYIYIYILYVYLNIYIYICIYRDIYRICYKTYCTYRSYLESPNVDPGSQAAGIGEEGPETPSSQTS